MDPLKPGNALSGLIGADETRGRLPSFFEQHGEAARHLLILGDVRVARREAERDGHFPSPPFVRTRAYASTWNLSRAGARAGSLPAWGARWVPPHVGARAGSLPVLGRAGSLPACWGALGPSLRGARAGSLPALGRALGPSPRWGARGVPPRVVRARGPSPFRACAGSPPRTLSWDAALMGPRARARLLRACPVGTTP